MSTSQDIAPQSLASRPLSWVGVVLLITGLCGHLFAARAMGGSSRAYRDHIEGFIILTLVATAILWAVGTRFWKGRGDITLVSVGIVQTLLGLMVYLLQIGVL